MGFFMEVVKKPNHPKHFLITPLVITLVIGFVLMVTIRKRYFAKGTTGNKKLLSRTYSNPPVVPGLPLIGNLLQLKDKIIHQTFANWSEIYGPIYSINIGASTIVVLNSTDVVKEAIVTKFSSISKQKHTYAMKILTLNTIVTSDSNEYHKMARRHLKQHRAHRDAMMDNIVKRLQAHAKENPLKPVNFRRIFQTEVFGLTLKQALGKDIGSAKYIEGLGVTLSRDEIQKVLVFDPLSGAVEMDWKDFFPYMRWVPNRRFKMHIERMETRRVQVMKTLIEEQLERISSGEDHLYHEIQKRCGNNKYSEEQYSEITCLSSIFHETLRKYPPFAIVLPLRYAHEDTQLGGYSIPAGTEIAINIYGCNMDKMQWDAPEEWKPERFLDSKYDPTDFYKTMSFGGGKRVFPGALQGLLITCSAIARCIQEFKWSLEPGREEQNMKTADHTSQKLNPLLAIVTPRDY
ncbi:hypothetical protein MKX03_020143 [Papaver bracteatum]|nr:hypothetical protein MKX03_020143 [Papaver bracteatum]